MKLIFCCSCYDLVALLGEKRTCKCGKSAGKYLADGKHAEISGPVLSIGISTPGIFLAAAHISDKHPKYHIECFARPNEGPHNPRTKVVKEVI